MKENILFVTYLPRELHTGEGYNGKCHYDVVKQIYGTRFYCINISGSADEVLEREIHLKGSSKIRKLFTLLSGDSFYLYRKAKETIIKAISQYNIDIVYFDNSISGKFIERLKKLFPSIKIVAFFIDIENDWMRQLIKQTRSPFSKLSLSTSIKNEILTARYADRCIVLNNRDSDLFYQYYGYRPYEKIPIMLKGRTNNRCDKHHGKETKLHALFVGANYLPNVKGLFWFVENVVKEIDFPFTLDVVGLEMEKHRTEIELISSCVNVIGTVDDLSPYYIASDVVVIPVFEGGGMKIKTGEAFAFGKVVCGTTESLMGYSDVAEESFIGNEIFVCDDKDSFITALTELFHREYAIYNPELPIWVEENFSQKEIEKRYQHVFDFSE